MTIPEFSIVLVMTLASWGMLCWAMRKLRPSSLFTIAFVILSLSLMVGAFALGSHWNQIDYTCKPNQHCFPWGN